MCINKIDVASKENIQKIEEYAKKEKLDYLIKNVGEYYKNKIGYAADFYIAYVSDGAKKL